MIEADGSNSEVFSREGSKDLPGVSEFLTNKDSSCMLFELAGDKGGERSRLSRKGRMDCNGSEL